MTPHVIASILPAMSEAEFEGLRSDIQKNGLIVPVWTFDGEILDGRHRYKACESLGVECRFREYQGDNPAAFVVSQNLHRRNLSESQRAMIAAKIANMGRGRPQKTANLRIKDVQLSSEDVANRVNVSARSVETARRVQKNCDPELCDAVSSALQSLP